LEQQKSKQQIYNELYEKASEVIRRIDPCEIRVVDGKASCFSSRNGRERAAELCCEGCRHLTMGGCSIKALACRLWLCLDVWKTEKGKEARDELFKLEREAYRLGVEMPYRSSPFVVLNDSAA
jgi:hypothetical protein